MRYSIKLAYKGTDFHGWQNQPNAVTVQAEIEKALSVLLRIPIDIVGCGRTDAGVHASDYYAHFDSEFVLDTEQMAYKLNALLPKTIVIYRIFQVRNDFHARFDAQQRTYQYFILTGNNPFTLDTSWQIPQGKFNLDKMNEGAAILLKHQDFRAFSKSKTDVKNYLCTITEASWKSEGAVFVFTISANRFLRNMVRAIVGTLLEVGIEKISVDDFEHIVMEKDRTKAGLSVPAKGLFLTHIAYNSFD